MRDNIVSAPTFSAAMTRAPVPLIVPPNHLGSGRLFNRHRLAGDHRLIDRAGSLRDGAVNGHRLTGSHPQSIPDVDLVKGYFLVRAIGPKASRCLGRQLEERPNRATGLLPRAQLQHLSQQHQNRNHRCGFVIDRDEAAMLPKPHGKKARGKRRCQTVQVGRAYA
jgi:hypothetical protein